MLIFENSNEVFAEVVQWVLCLVYIRPAEVPEYFDAICEYVQAKITGEEKDDEFVYYAKSLKVFFQYLLDTWIGTEDDDGNHLPALFDTDHWSAWRSLVDSTIPTSSDGAEAYNQAITKEIGNSGKRFWRTVQAIQDEECLSR